MRTTRRNVARLLGLTPLLVGGAAGQSITPAAPATGDALATARAQVQQNATLLSAVKIPRSLEPASRFEA